MTLTKGGEAWGGPLALPKTPAPHSVPIASPDALFRQGFMELYNLAATCYDFQAPGCNLSPVPCSKIVKRKQAWKECST